MSFFRVGGRGILFSPAGPRSLVFAPPPATSEGRLWLNLSFPYDWGRDLPFIDVMRYAREWRAQTGSAFNDPAALATMMASADADGYPTVIPSGVACATLILTEQGTAVAPILAGRYRVDWVGEGTVSVFGGTNQTNGTNWREFDFSPTDSNLVDVRINLTNPANHVRGMRCYRVDHASLLAAGNVAHPGFKDVWGGVKLLRFMDSTLTNTSPAVNWSQAATATSIGRGLSLHDMVALCNELGCDMWACMPYASNSDYVTQAATVVRDNLHTNLKAYVEYANEWWNFAGGFQTAPYLNAIASTKGYNWAQVAGGRSTETMQAWSAVFAGQMHRTVRVGGMHTTWHEINDDFIYAPNWVAEQPGRVAPHTVHDAFAITAYFNCPNEEWEEVLTAATANYASGAALVGSKLDADVTRIITDHYPYYRSLCNGLGKQLVMYEGGTHLINPGGLSNPTLANTLVADLNEGDTMYARYARLMAAWDLVGDGGFNAYSSVTRPNPTATTFGLQHHLLDTAQSRFQAAQDYNNDTLELPGSGAGTPVGGKTAHVYMHLNSLYNHANPSSAQNASTRVGNWVKRMAEAAVTAPSGKNTFTINAQFGFFTAWSTPPSGSAMFEEVSSPYIAAWTTSWSGASNINQVGFVPDNFDGQDFDPAVNTNMGASYQTRLLALIDAWETNAPNPDRVYFVFSGWPAMQTYGGSGNNPGTIPAGPPSGYAGWVAYGLGAYQTWMELLVSRLRAARPSLDIRLHNSSKASLLAFRDTMLGTVNKNTLFEDMAPHGRGSMYLIAGIAEYIELYDEKPPANLFESGGGWSGDPGWPVDAAIKSNYQSLVDFIWGVLRP